MSRRDDIRAAVEKHDKPIAKTTKGKGRHYQSVEEGAGMTEAGRKAYNAKNNANLKAPAPNPKTDADKGRKASFCARMGGVVKNSKNAERAKASMRRWNCG
jgi:hypothetical protein